MQKDHDTSGEFEPIRFHDVASSFLHPCRASIALHLLNIHWNIPRYHYHGNKKEKKKTRMRTITTERITKTTRPLLKNVLQSSDALSAMTSIKTFRKGPCESSAAVPERDLPKHPRNAKLQTTWQFLVLSQPGSCTVPISGSRPVVDSHVGTIARLRRVLVLLHISLWFSWNSCISCAVSSCATRGIRSSLTEVVVGGLEPLVAAKLSLDFRMLSTSSSKSSNALCQSRCLNSSEVRNKIKDD